MANRSLPFEIILQGIAEVVETLLDDVDSYLDDAAGRGANQQVSPVVVS